MFSITDNRLAAGRRTGLSDYKELACAPDINFDVRAKDQSLIVGYIDYNSEQFRDRPVLIEKIG
jgi:hypothetical protein